MNRAGQSTVRHRGVQADWRADEQAGPSDANYRTAPRRAWRNEGTEQWRSGQLMGSRRERERRGETREEACVEKWAAVSFYSCWCKTEENLCCASFILSRQWRVIRERRGSETIWEVPQEKNKTKIKTATFSSYSHDCCQSSWSQQGKKKSKNKTSFSNGRSLLISSWQAKRMRA